jgi:hypothetical protein
MQTTAKLCFNFLIELIHIHINRHDATSTFCTYVYLSLEAPLICNPLPKIGTNKSQTNL